MKKLLLFMMLCVASGLPAYFEAFNSYALDSNITANPPNYAVLGGQSFLVKAGFGGQCAQMQSGTGAWKSALYLGATYTTVDVGTLNNSAAAGYCGVIGRGDSTDASGLPANGYLWFIQPATTTWFLYKDVATVLTLISTGSYTVADATKFTLRLTISGTSLTGYVDGNSQTSQTDSSLSSAGYIGFISFGGTTSYTNISDSGPTTATPTSTGTPSNSPTPTTSPTPTNTPVTANSDPSRSRDKTRTEIRQVPTPVRSAYLR